MDKTKLELLNISSDLRRAVMYYVNSTNPTYQDCVFLKNIVKNFPQLSSLDPEIKKYINISYLKDDSDLPKVKAESLLLSSLQLQSYLLN